MIRVLQITGSLNIGGTETFIMNVFREIRKNNIVFDFLLFDNSKEGFFEEAISLGAKIYVLPSRREGFFTYNKELNHFFKVHHTEYNIVHYSGCTLSSVAPLFFAKRYGIPCRIAHGHSSNWTGLHNFILHSINRLFVPYLATHYFACSDIAASFFFSKRKNTIILKNGIKLSRFRFNCKIREEVREELGILNEELVFGHIGRLAPVKNHLFLLEVFKQINMHEKCAKLILVGNGELMASIIKKSDELGIRDRILFLGERNDINRILQAMDIMIFPSLYEGLPFALIEAQASGLHIYASDTVSNEANITGNIHYLSLTRTAEEWGNYILKNVKYERTSQDEIMKSKGFSIEDTADILFDVYSGYNEDL